MMFRYIKENQRKCITVCYQCCVCHGSHKISIPNLRQTQIQNLPWEIQCCYVYLALLVWFPLAVERNWRNDKSIFFKLQPWPFTISRHTSQTLVSKSPLFLYFLPALKSMLQLLESTERGMTIIAVWDSRVVPAWDL